MLHGDQTGARDHLAYDAPHAGPPHHPWRVFSRLRAWRLRWAELPDGHYGRTCFRTMTVTVAEGLSQAERRCTIAHETQHILRGPAELQAGRYSRLREELDIDRTVSRLLMPSAVRLADSLAWARNDLEDAADDLWVDDLLLQVRLSTLTSGERAYLDDRLAGVWLDEAAVLVRDDDRTTRSHTRGAGHGLG